MRVCEVDECDLKVHAKGWCQLHYARWKRWGNPLEESHRKVRGSCSVGGGEGAHYGNGLCSKHWQERRRRDRHVPERSEVVYPDPETAFAERTRWDHGCLVWTGALSGGKYGHLSVRGAQMLAHHYAWQRAGLEVPDGLFLDHTCHNEACVNVDHLRLATRSQNNAYRRGAQANNTSGRRGVTWSKAAGKWMARCGKEYIGLFDDPDEAASAASARRREVYGEFAGMG